MTKQRPIIKFKKLDPNAIPPEYKTDGAAGIDLSACFPDGVRIMHLEPGERKLIPTGIAIEIPEGFEGQLRSRSGLTKNSGLVMATGVSTIDSDYRGECGVLLHNISSETQRILNGDRIAQLVITQVERAVILETEELSNTARGTKGYGSTGT